MFLLPVLNAVVPPSGFTTLGSSLLLICIPYFSRKPMESREVNSYELFYIATQLGGQRQHG